MNALPENFGNVAGRLSLSGYAPLPVEGKRAFLENWPQYAFPAADAERYARYNVGILTRQTPAVDIDVRNEQIAAEIDAEVVALLGVAPVRIGAAPKRLRVYRLSGEPFKKVSTPGYMLQGEDSTAPDYKFHKVEILADGEQFVAYGIHPDTQRPYVWDGAGSPLTVPSRTLPSITAEQAQEIIRRAAAILNKYGRPGGRLSQQEDARPRRSNEQLAAKNPALCRQALAALKNEDWPREDWIRVGMAIKGALGEAGKADWMRITAQSSKHHNESTAERAWESFAPDRIGAGSIWHWAKATGWEPPQAEAPPPREQEERTAPKVFTGGPIGLEALLTETPLPLFVIAGVLPTDVGSLVAPGKTGKSTFCLLEAIHIILGKPFLGRAIVRSGPVLFVTQEDSRARIEHRVFHLCKELNLNEQQRGAVAEQLWIEDVVGKEVRLVEADRNGNLTQTRYVDELIEKYGDKGFVLINVDPQNFFSPGERFVNDGEAGMMAAGARIVRATGAAVRFIHHTGKANAREKATDQYAGRGGSAGSDNGRFTQVLQRWDKRIEEMGMPGAFTDEDFREGRCLSFNCPAVSDAPAVMELQWLRRRGWGFSVVDIESDSEQIANQRDLATLIAFLRGQIADGVKHTLSTLEDIDSPALPFARKRLRSLVHLALQRQHIVEVELPKEEQRGQKKTYLNPQLQKLEEDAPEAPAADGRPQKAPAATAEDHRLLNALALACARASMDPVAPAFVAEIAAQERIVLPGVEAGTKPAQVIGGVLYRVTGKSGVTVAHSPVEGGPPEKVTLRRSGSKGAWRYQFYIGDSPPRERADGM